MRGAGSFSSSICSSTRFRIWMQVPSIIPFISVADLSLPSKILNRYQLSTSTSFLSCTLPSLFPLCLFPCSSAFSSPWFCLGFPYPRVSLLHVFGGREWVERRKLVIEAICVENVELRGLRYQGSSATWDLDHENDIGGVEILIRLLFHCVCPLRCRLFCSLLVNRNHKVPT